MRTTKKLFAPALLSLISLAVVATFLSCASTQSTNAQIDTALKSEPRVVAGEDLAAQSRHLIMEADSLNQDQKDKLLGLHTKMAKEMAKNREELGKLKMLLFRTLMDPKGDAVALEKIKGRIIRLDRQKTDRMLRAYDDVLKILGRRSVEDEKFFRALMMEHTSGLHSFQ